MSLTPKDLVDIEKIVVTPLKEEIGKLPCQEHFRRIENLEDDKVKRNGIAEYKKRFRTWSVAFLAVVLTALGLILKAYGVV